MISVWDIPKIDAVMEHGKPDESDRTAWCRIKKELKELVQQSTNNARDETVRSCTSCGNEHCSMQAGFCSNWVRDKRTASPVA